MTGTTNHSRSFERGLVLPAYLLDRLDVRPTGGNEQRAQEPPG